MKDTVTLSDGVSEMRVPTGRYSFYLQGEPYTVKITRSESKRRWTTVCVWTGTEWAEVVNPDHKRIIMAKLAGENTDLATASALYAKLHNKCGVCTFPCTPEHEHDNCLARKYGQETLSANG